MLELPINVGITLGSGEKERNVCHGRPVDLLHDKEYYAYQECITVAQNGEGLIENFSVLVFYHQPEYWI